MTPRRRALEVLCLADPAAKAAQARALFDAAGAAAIDTAEAIAAPPGLPGRPPRPLLVPPKQVPTRSPFTTEGRAALLQKQQRPILILLAVSLLIGVFTLSGYGDSWDDLSLRKYAIKSLAAYSTWPVNGEMQITSEDLGNYGPSYVMAVALISQDNPDSRHLIYFVTFLAGVWAFYMLGLRWLTPPAALGAAMLYLTQPLFWGHAFFNPKDTPFLSFFLISIYFGFKLFDKEPQPI